MVLLRECRYLIKAVSSLIQKPSLSKKQSSGPPWPRSFLRCASCSVSTLWQHPTGSQHRSLRTWEPVDVMYPAQPPKAASGGKRVLGEQTNYVLHVGKHVLGAYNVNGIKHAHIPWNIKLHCVLLNHGMMYHTFTRFTFSFRSAQSFPTPTVLQISAQNISSRMSS